jgi:hypothetical protein
MHRFVAAANRVVYKVDRLTRSLADFAKLVETFDVHGVSSTSISLHGRFGGRQRHDIPYRGATLWV